MDTAGGRTRREALEQGARVGLAGAAGVAGVAGLAGAAGAAFTPGSALAAGTSTTSGSPTDSPVSEPERVRRLLGVELLLLYCYQQVLASPILGPREVRTLSPLRIQEEAHVQALQARLRALGTAAPQPPRSTAEANRYLAHRHVGGRLGQLKGANDALWLLMALEKVAVGAYFVSLLTLRDRSLIMLVAEMMACDAQHEAVIGDLYWDGDATQAVSSGLVQGTQ